MADEMSTQLERALPGLNFYFQVKLGGDVISVQEVSGLEPELAPVEHRRDSNPNLSVLKMPGMEKLPDVTLKRGVIQRDSKLWRWLSDLKLNTEEPMPSTSNITISLLDESGVPSMVWTLANARLTYIAATELSTQGGDVAIESIVIAHEGVTTCTG